MNIFDIFDIDDRPPVTKTNYDIRKPRLMGWRFKSRQTLALALLPCLWFLSLQLDPRVYALTKYKAKAAYSLPHHLPISSKPGVSIPYISLYINGPKSEYQHLIFTARHFVPHLQTTVSGQLVQEDSLLLMVSSAAASSTPKAPSKLRWLSKHSFEVTNDEGVFRYTHRQPSIQSSFSFIRHAFFWYL